SWEVFAGWRVIPFGLLAQIKARPLLDAGESCGVSLGAATSVFDRQATGFWDIARNARIGVAVNQTSENIAAQLSAFRRVVGNGADVATVAEFVAEAFASEVLDRQFGPLTLNAMFGPAVLLRGPTDNWRSDGEWSAVSIAYKPYAASATTRENAERPRPSVR